MTAVRQLPDWRIDALGTYFAYVRIPEGAHDAKAVGEALATECGLLSLVGPFFGPGQERHLRLAFANVGLGGDRRGAGAAASAEVAPKSCR